MRRLSRSSLTFLLTGTLALPFAAACGGDDDGGSDPDASAGDPDAGDDPDADPGPVLLRSGTMAITEATVLTGGEANLQGQLNVISFNDETTRTVAPLPGFESPIQGCAVVVYDVAGGDETPDLVDEGNITVTGTSAGPFVCASSASADPPGEYVCQSTDEDIAGGVEGNADGSVLNGVTDSLIVGDGIVTDAWIGMWIRLDGHPSLPDGTTFPIVNADGDTNTLTLFDVPDLIDDVLGDEDTTFTTFVGAGPRPGPVVDFIPSEASEVTITKAAGDVIPEIDETIEPAGQGFTLVEDAEMDYYLPNAIPTDASGDVSFHCEDCGDEGSAPGGGFTALIINGSTTDVLPAKDDNGLTMLPAETSYATFQCSFLGTVSTATIPQEAMEAIMDTDPARIQVSVGRVAGYPKSSPDFDWTANIVLGHTIVGYTTVD